MATVVISINTTWNVVNFRSGLIAAFIRAGHRVVAVSPPDAHVDALCALGAEHVPITIDSKGLSPIADLRLMLAYRRILRDIQADVFLGYTVKPNIYGSIAAATLGVAVINNVSGLGTAFIRQGLLTRIVAGLYRLAFRHSRLVFFQNADDRALFVANKLVDAAKTDVLPGSGIDLARFVPPAERNEDGFDFLLVARLLRDKGVVEYVDAARMVRRVRPDTRFALLGFLDAVNRTAITRAEVESWQAEGVIHYLGAADDVRPAIAEADVLVLPSYREGLPRTLLEGAAMARPLIATDVPGCRVIVRDGVNGFLCTPRDAASLAAAMEKMLGRPYDQRRAMGLAGRRIVENEFDEKIVVDRYIAAIDDVTGADRDGRAYRPVESTS